MNCAKCIILETRIGILNKTFQNTINNFSKDVDIHRQAIHTHGELINEKIKKANETLENENNVLRDKVNFLRDLVVTLETDKKDLKTEVARRKYYKHFHDKYSEQIKLLQEDNLEYKRQIKSLVAIAFEAQFNKLIEEHENIHCISVN